MYRNTYLEINLKNIEENVRNIVKNNIGYKYYFGVVKADCYGHDDIQTVKSIIKGGCNYLCVATLEEAIQIRKALKDIPILCLGLISKEYIKICKKKNITITIPSLKYIQDLESENTKDLKVHFKLNTGMNRLGINEKKELQDAFDIAQNNKMNIEGIYTHIYDASDKERYNKQIENFQELIQSIDIQKIKIIHTSASDAMINYDIPANVNGCRLGIIMYGFAQQEKLKLKSTFSLKSQVVQINNLKKGETLGYNGAYKADEDQKVAVVSIGYADGIIRKNTGRTVFIKKKEYPIVGNICMDMLFVKVDDNVELYDEVVILKDIEHIKRVSKHLDTIPYEVLCSIGKRVPRIYK